MIKYFKLSELNPSDYAKAHNIDNSIKDINIYENLIKLFEELDNVRSTFGKPIKVNSAYRSKELNQSIGGSSTSNHLYGRAADICPISGYTVDFARHCVEHCGFVYHGTPEFGRTVTYKNDKYEVIDYGTFIHFAHRK